MDELQKAIEQITYESRKFQAAAFRTITEHKDKAIPLLRGAIDRALEEQDELEGGYQLSFYALFLLAEFQDRVSFPKIVELATLPEEVTEYLLGDAVTSGLSDILYNTYNGDLELLKQTVQDAFINEFVRAAMLEVMGQLYLDGTLDEQEWKAFIKQGVYSEEEPGYFYDALATVICRCHFVDMLPEIRYMLDQGLMDEMCLGTYDSCVDEMFSYRELDKAFCKTPVCAADTLKTWAMFEPESDPKSDEQRQKEFEDYMKAAGKSAQQKEAGRKIGRNDPCPCGSGKKYKFCCLNKPKSSLDAIENIQERNKCLEYYPYVGKEKETGKVYLEEYFDAESIEIDRLLYLGMADRSGLVWLRDDAAEEKRCRQYLTVLDSGVPAVSG